MSELISGKEALIALANGRDVLCIGKAYESKPDDSWIDAKEVEVGIFLNDAWSFKLKPRTITINGIEVPAPFEPKHGEIFWHIDVREICSYNYKQEWSDSDEYLQLGAWRNEEEIKQVVAALRSIFK